MGKTHIIAVAGKGGVGKTTTCGMMIDYLCKAGKGPLLVVDADANSNLNEVLGVEVETTLGDIREEMAQAEKNGTVPPSMTKADYAEMKFSSALVEEDDYDMLVMGRTQGKGCYCFVNGVLKTQIDKYVGNYKYMVIDNEAGLEHISRGTLPHVDTMLLISDCSRRGIQAAGRLAEMIRDLELKPGVMKLIVNRAPNGELNPGVAEEIEKYHLELAGVLPQDETVYAFDCEGKPSSQVPDDAPVKKALAGKNILVLSARDENYKAIGAGAGLAYGQKVGAESAVDINLAKQLNTVMTQLGVNAQSIVMNIGSAAAGYGFEYVASTLDRVKDAALSQSDAMLQMPIITPVSADTWGVKESIMPEADMPEWGSQEERGIEMEIVTAAAVLASGSDAVIMRHPEAIRTIAAMIGELV